MENGYLPPHKLVTAYLDIDLKLGEGEKAAIVALNKMKTQIDEIFQVDPEDVTFNVSIDDDDDDDDDNDDDDEDEPEIKDEL